MQEHSLKIKNFNFSYLISEEREKKKKVNKKVE